MYNISVEIWNLHNAKKKRLGKHKNNWEESKELHPCLANFSAFSLNSHVCSMYLWQTFNTMKLFMFLNLTIICVLYMDFMLNMTKPHEREKGYSTPLASYSWTIMFQEFCSFAYVIANSCQVGLNIPFCQLRPCLCDVFFGNWL
jgi:hypothetical protein